MLFRLEVETLPKPKKPKTEKVKTEPMTQLITLVQCFDVKGGIFRSTSVQLAQRSPSTGSLASIGEASGGSTQFLERVDEVVGHLAQSVEGQNGH